ncbi:MAG: T9SS type A sorting domain-containing protein [Bacteroidales bacterium]|nr:T9SS type A sorting domain-containing protein [Bacteroidales bacterium]
MRCARCYILLIVCLLLPVAAVAQVSENALFELLRNVDGSYRLDFRIGNVAFSQGQDNQVDFYADGMVNLAPDTGLPALPQASRLVVLPRGAELRVERCEHGESEVLPLPEGKILMPWQGAAVKDAEPLAVGADKAVYATDSYVRWGNPVEVENLGAMGSWQLFRVTVHPVAYNPVAGEVTVEQHISATLTTTGSQLLETSVRLPERYLIVSRPQFREGLQPFVHWKRQEGYKVTEIYADTNKRDEVKALISGAFGDGIMAPTPSYILIVGDAAQIQAYVGTSRPTGLNTHPTDLYYAEHTGDYLPDAIVGRWPVNDTAELRAVVEKTLRYERGINLDTDALNRVLLVAGTESQNPAPVTTNGQVNYLKREIRQAEPLVDTFCYYNPTSANQRGAILADIRNGIGLLNYTAHCTTAGWSNPAVSFTTIDTLDAQFPTVYVNNCCQSNNFTGTCFGEQLLRMPHSGGVAVIGATNSTLWNEDYYWSVGPKYPLSTDPQHDSLRPGAFDRWIGGEINTVGQLLAAGNLAVMAFGSPYDRFYWEIYNLFGDPALVPWIGVPQRVQLSVPDTLAVGTMELRVSGTPGALVSAVQGNELLGVVRLDEHCSSLLRFCRATDTLPVLFTATKPRMLPVEYAVPSAMPRGKAAAFTDVTLGHGQVAFTLVNLGTDTLYGVGVTLTEADSGSMYASFSADTLAIDTLLPQATHTTYLIYHIDRWAPQLAATLAATDSDGDSWCLSLGLNLGVMTEMTFSIRNTDTSAATALLRGQTYLVGATPNGYYDTINTSAVVLPGNDTFELGGGGWMPVAVGDDAAHIRIAGLLGHGNCFRNYEYYAIVGCNCDGFGNGMQAYPWQTGGTQPWTVDSTVSHSGRYSLRSGAIDYRQTSDLTLQLLLPNDDSISFWLRTSSEQSYDKLAFYIDGIRALEASGDNDWRRYAYRLMSGAHSLRWRYVKDESTSIGGDCVWLDDVSMPLALWDAPYGTDSDDGMLGIADKPVAECSMRLYPNPSNGNVTITADGLDDGSLQVSDLYGRIVYAADLHTVDMSSTLNLPLPDGIYFVELRTDSGTMRAKMIIIRQ